MEIKVSSAREYWKIRLRPMCEKARLFCAIIGSKTFTEDQVRMIKELGYEVSVVAEVSTLLWRTT